MTLRRCEFCNVECGQPMCKQCGISYDRYAHDSGNMMTALVWAARRARRQWRPARLLRAKAGRG